MADTKISALTAATTPLAGTEVLPIVQSGVTKKVSVANLTAGRSVATGALTSTSTTEGAAIGSLGNAVTSSRSTNDSQIYMGYRSTPNAFVIGASYGSTGAYLPIILATSDTAKMTVATGGDVTVNTGNLVIGTSGKGIDFSVTSQAGGMTSELLNDYEEGTWTPTDWSGAGLSISSSGARYTKIGRLVHVQAFIGYPATANGAAAGITGLPFAAGANIPIKALPSNGVVLGGYIGSGNSGIEFKLSNNYTTSVANASLSSAGIMLDVTYSI